MKGLRFSNQQNATKKPNVETGREPTNSRPKHRLLIYSLLVIGLFITISCIGYVYSRNLSTDSIGQSQVAKASSDTNAADTPSHDQPELKSDAPAYEEKPFDFVTDREKMIGFAFARLQNARYKNNEGTPVTFDEMTLYTMGIHHLKHTTEDGNEIQSRLSRDPDGQNFMYLETKGNPASMDLALDAALEFQTVYTWVDATKPAMEAFTKLEAVRKGEDSYGFNQSRSELHQAQVGNGVATWYIQINEQFEADSYGPPWAKILLQWDWKPIEN